MLSLLPLIGIFAAIFLICWQTLNHYNKIRNYLLTNLANWYQLKIFSILIFDEIHIRSNDHIRLNYAPYGLDHKDNKNPAKTIFRFMSKSIFWKYQEVEIMNRIISLSKQYSMFLWGYNLLHLALHWSKVQWLIWHKLYFHCSRDQISKWALMWPALLGI